MDVSSEACLFLLSCLIGIGFGLFYDVFRIVRLVFPHHMSIVFIEDILYFLVLTLISFSFFINQSNGVVRGFVIVGELLGAVLYFFTLSLVVMKSANAVINFISLLLKLLFKLFVSPVVFLVKLIVKPFIMLFKFIFKKIVFQIKKNMVNIFTKKKIHLN